MEKLVKMENLDMGGNGSGQNFLFGNFIFYKITSTPNSINDSQCLCIAKYTLGHLRPV